MIKLSKDYDLTDYEDDARISVEEKYNKCPEYQEFLKSEFEASEKKTWEDFLNYDDWLGEYLAECDDFIDTQYQLMIYHMKDDLMRFLGKLRRKDIGVYKKKLHEEESILYDSGWYKLPKFEQIEGFIQSDDRYGYNINLDENEIISLLYTI